MRSNVNIHKLKILTYPLNSYYFYQNPDICQKLSDSKIEEALVTQMYEDISQDTYMLREDFVKRVKDMCWTVEDGKLNKIKLLEDISDEHLDFHNKKIIVKRSHNHNEKFSEKKVVGNSFGQIFSWNILKTFMNEDILIAVFMSKKNFTNTEYMPLWSNSVFNTDEAMDTVLEKGISELHMHVGAAKDVQTLWQMCINNIHAEREHYLDKLAIQTYMGNIKLKNYIKVATIVRFLFALSLREEKSLLDIIKDLNQEELLKTQEEKSKSIVKLGEILKKFESGENLEEVEQKLDVSLDLLFDKLKLFKLKSSANYYSGYREQILVEDPLSIIFEEFKLNQTTNRFEIKKEITLPESILLKKSIERVKNGKDKAFIKLFWQYIRVKNMFHKSVIQGISSGRGLDVFSRYYKKQGALTSENYIEQALYNQCINQNIKKIEIRTTPSKDYNDLKNKCIDILSQYLRFLLKTNLECDEIIEKKEDILKSEDLKGNYPLLGIIYHFIKKESKNNKLCKFIEEKTGDNSYAFCGREKTNYDLEAENIMKLRNSVEGISNYIVGVDAASKELKADSSSFKKAYEIISDSKYNFKEEESTGSLKRNMGLTYHVGEEFRDIVSGLRAVDEVIEELSFKAGDRIGHGIVLGIDIDKWSNTNPIVYIRYDEYLKNLLWEWNLYTSDVNYRDIENIAYIENEIMDMAERIFGFTDGITVRDLYFAYRSRFSDCSYHKNIKDCEIIEFTKKKHQIKTRDIYSVDEELWDKIWTRRSIVKAINCKYFVEKEFKKTVEIHMNGEMKKKYRKLQDYMLKKISERGIVLELNPTSNLTIGEFRSFEDYHIKRLSNPKCENVIVTINSDDPSVFNTNLSNEYGLIHDIMLKDGDYSKKEVLEWLNKIRKNGYNYSFIRDRRLTKKEMVAELINLIQKLRD